MRSEFNDWYEKWTGSKVKCENTDIIGAWQHQQSKVDELQKRVDKAIRLLVEAELYQFEPNIGLAEQALKGGGE